VPRNNERPNDSTFVPIFLFAVLHNDWVDEHAPLDALHHAGERVKRRFARELTPNALGDCLERLFGIGADQRIELETGNRNSEIRHDGDDLCTGDDLKKCLDDQTGLFARTV
jgi:hypothetical protein